MKLIALIFGMMALLSGCLVEDSFNENSNNGDDVRSDDGSTAQNNRESSDGNPIVGDGSDSNLDHEPSNSYNTTNKTAIGFYGNWSSGSYGDNEAAAIEKAEADFKILVKELGLDIE